MHAVHVLAGTVAALLSASATDAQLSRPGAVHLDARSVVVSVFPDSLDGVHFDAKIRNKGDWVRCMVRFDPDRLVEWLAAVRPLVQRDTAARQGPKPVQSRVLAAIGGTRGIALALPTGKAKRDFYWLLHRLEDTPLLIKADRSFTDTLLTALQEAAQLSAIDSAAFESGLVAPVVDQPDSMHPWPIHIPTPKYPANMASGGVEGLVQVRFDIQADGLVDIATFEMLWTSAPEFVPPVKEALSRGRFRPAKSGGKAVRRRAYQDARFRVGGQPAYWN